MIKKKKKLKGRIFLSQPWGKKREKVVHDGRVVKRQSRVLVRA